MAGRAAKRQARRAEKLAGYNDRYRRMQGSYRIIYLINDERREVTIFGSGHRKEAYR